MNKRQKKKLHNKIADRFLDVIVANEWELINLTREEVKIFTSKKYKPYKQYKKANNGGNKK